MAFENKMKKQNFRDKIYYWSLNLVQKGFKLEGIFLLLATWNFAYLRYYMRTFDLNKFERILAKCDFDFFKNKKFEDIDLTDKIVIDKIKNIYRALSSIDGIKYVGATKIMHLLNPQLFVMWDRNIIKHYKAKTTPQGYVNFMALMQKMYKEGKFKNLRKDVTIPRAIDLYNMECFSKY